MKRVRIAFVVLLAVVAASGALLYFLSRGFSARDKPTAAEAWIARRLRHLAAPRSAREMTNPIAASPEALSQAMEHFADHCALCHANDGSGDTVIGKGLYPRPPDMRQADTQNLSDGELYYIIHNGVRFTGMPAFGSEDGSPDEDSWKLVHFVRRLPHITDDELARMKDLNPKSPADLEEEEEIRKFLEGSEDEPSHHNHKH